MNNISTAVNVTRDTLPELRNAILSTINANFINACERYGIKRKCDDILITMGESENSINIVQEITGGTNRTLSSIPFDPYVSYVSYDKFNEIGNSTEVQREVYTVLLSFTIDNNIMGFSILSPSDLSLVSDSIYEIVGSDSNKTVNLYQSTTEDTIFPNQIVIQTGLISDPNSYYELSYYSCDDDLINTINIPCISNTFYMENTDGELVQNTTLTLLEDKVMSTEYTSSLIMLPKLLAAKDANTVAGFMSELYDCPNLGINSNYSFDGINKGDTIIIGDSQYIVIDNNTLIQLFNTEVRASNWNGYYDGKSHFCTLTYPSDTNAYYKLSTQSNETDNWQEILNRFEVNTDFIDVGTYEINYKITRNDIPITYGTSYVYINPAKQYGYFINAYDGVYDGQPHTVTIYASVGTDITFSSDGINYSSSVIPCTDVGEHTIYYKLVKENYEDVLGSATVIIRTADNSSTGGWQELDSSEYFTYDSLTIIPGIKTRKFYYMPSVTELTNSNIIYTGDYNNMISVSSLYPVTVTKTTAASGATMGLTATAFGAYNIINPGSYLVIIESTQSFFYDCKSSSSSVDTTTLKFFMSTAKKLTNNHGEPIGNNYYESGGKGVVALKETGNGKILYGRSICNQRFTYANAPTGVDEVFRASFLYTKKQGDEYSYLIPRISMSYYTPLANAPGTKNTIKTANEVSMKIIPLKEVTTASVVESYNSIFSTTVSTNTDFEFIESQTDLSTCTDDMFTWTIPYVSNQSGKFIGTIEKNGNTLSLSNDKILEFDFNTMDGQKQFDLELALPLQTEG